MIEGTAGKPEVRAGEAELDDVGQVLPRQVGVGDHDALGPTGGARRVHQAVDIVGRRRAVRRLVGVTRRSARVVHPSGAVGVMQADEGGIHASRRFVGQFDE